MDNLTTELAAAEAQLAKTEEQLSVLASEAARQSERVQLLRRLIELDNPGLPPGTKKAPERRAVRARLEDAVADILAKHAGSLHISEIHQALKSRGVRIPGKGTDANIIARILRDERIEREKGHRGFYRLRPVAK